MITHIKYIMLKQKLELNDSLSATEISQLMAYRDKQLLMQNYRIEKELKYFKKRHAINNKAISNIIDELRYLRSKIDE